MLDVASLLTSVEVTTTTLEREEVHSIFVALANKLENKNKAKVAKSKSKSND
jgi:hypothetical protein